MTTIMTNKSNYSLIKPPALTHILIYSCNQDIYKLFRFGCFVMFLNPPRPPVVYKRI